MSATMAPRRPRIRRELGIGLLLFAAYVAVELVGGPQRRLVADRHAWDLLHLEQSLGIDVEGAMNRWLHPHRILTVLANYEYAFTYIASAAALLVWVYLRRPESYVPVRDSFVVLNLLGIACFLLYPLTPPRLLPGLRLVDTVERGHTIGSWGSPVVAHANQLAAMPSLHVAWALWVSVMLKRLLGGRRVQVLSAAHVVLTCLVIVATANHFVLDAVGGAIAVGLAVVLADLWDRSRRPGWVVPSADAFFCYVESDSAPQHVGGLGILAARPDIEEVRRRLGEALPDIPGFRRRLEPATRWRRPRWVDVDDVDLAWHVTEHDLGRALGRPADLADVHAHVAGAAARRMPVDRPLWRVTTLCGLQDGRAALVVLAHHTIADGPGVVGSVLRFLDPQAAEQQAPRRSAPGMVRRVAGTVLGLAQLAADGFCKVRLDGSASAPARRDFAVAELDLEVVRRVARDHRCRVTDVLLSAVAGSLARCAPGLSHRLDGTARVAVPLLATDPASTTGNVTAAVMLDLPLDPMPDDERLALIAARSHRLRTPARVLASRMVMAQALALVPAPLARWFARTVYGRRSFHGIVSNMAGPAQPTRLAGVPLTDVVPIIPLAPGSPLALGALGWAGRLGLGLTTDPALLSATEVCAGIREVVADLSAADLSGTEGPSPVRELR